MTMIVHATKNEMGMISGGVPGDQTKTQVVKQEFFEYEWEYVFRPKDKEIAKKLVKNAEDIAANDNIGYSQGDRYSMYLRAKKLNWDFAAVTEPCYTDCSQLVASNCIAVGISVSPYMYTGNEKGALMATGYFDLITYKTGMTLEPGDILLTTKRGHTATVVERTFPDTNPSWLGECYGVETAPVYSEPDESSDFCSWPILGTGNLFDVCDEKDDWYYIRIANVNFGWIKKQFVLRKTPWQTGIVKSGVTVRQNAGSSFKKLGTLNDKDKIEICDVKKASNGVNWYYIKYKKSFGFCSSKYITDVKEI